MIRRSKYGSVKTRIDGITFDSRLEAEYYVYLKRLKQTGVISDFERQVSFELVASYRQPETNKHVRAVVYKLDFVIVQLDGTKRYVDTKGVETPDFKIKKKLFESKYNVRLVLVKRKGKGWVEE